MIVLLDYGAGNVRSVHKALETVGAEVKLTRDPAPIAEAEKIVLPGVGAFGDCMSGLRRAGMIEPLLQAVEQGKPLLGICVGMQVLFEEGLEMGNHAGLDLLPGRVVRFPDALTAAGLKIPHTGWNQIEPLVENPLLHDLPRGSWAYFNHAYYCQAQAEHTLAVTNYGGPFASVVRRGQVYGVQFHPEKSQRVGLHILRNFVEKVGEVKTGTWNVYPAIDLRHGRVVRLKQGDPGRETQYAEDPLQIARRWQEAGAKWLHVVNLDGALGEGGHQNLAALERILKNTTGRPSEPVEELRIQFGGGLRDLASIRRVLELGVSRVVLGTAAVKDPALVEAALENFGPERVAIGIDARAGKAQTHGWQHEAEITALDLAQGWADKGIRWLIFTDVARDGMRRGLNLEATVKLARETGLNVIASGGVASLEDVEQTHEAGLSGVIIGKALYEGQVALEEALGVGRSEEEETC